MDWDNAEMQNNYDALMGTLGIEQSEVESESVQYPVVHSAELDMRLGEFREELERLEQNAALCFGVSEQDLDALFALGEELGLPGIVMLNETIPLILWLDEMG